ncbi:MAG TPA: peptide ABC transporter substrate-binding protein [Chloroflexota bacterium]|nr:peptide ABC transporter substrate-binding protein [Chloroflexota bacterium]
MHVAKSLGSLAMVAFIVTGCATTPSRGAVDGGADGARSASGPKRMTIGLRGDPPSMARERTNPSGSVSSVPGLDALQQLLHVGLVHANYHGELLPLLAENVPTVDNGLWQVQSDGQMVTTWKIKEGASWQDGHPFTTDDLLFTLSVDQDPDVGFARNNVHSLIDHVDAPDARTVVVTWSHPYIEADLLFSEEVVLPLPKHLLERAYTEDKANFLGVPYWSSEYVGTGPFKVRDWVLDSHIVAEANPKYILGRPRIDEIEVRFIQDPTTLAANLLSGADLTIGRALSLDQALQIKDQWNGTWVLTTRAWTPINVQFVNSNPAVVTNLRFRQAMLHALDRQQLVDSIMAGQSQISYTWVNPSIPEYQAIQDSIVKYDFDIRRAAQLVEGLGYRKGSDGYYLDGSGQRLTVELRTTVQNAIHPPTTAAVANAWEQLGVGVDQNLVSPQLAQDREYRAQFPAFELVQTGNTLTSAGIRRYLSTSAALPENHFAGGGNNSRYSNPDLDEAINRYLTTIPKSERNRALAQVVNIQTSQLSMLPLFYSTEPTMVSNRLKNVTGRGDVANEPWNAEEWDIVS